MVFGLKLTFRVICIRKSINCILNIIITNHMNLFTRFDSCFYFVTFIPINVNFSCCRDLVRRLLYYFLVFLLLLLQDCGLGLV